jgi:hypothetical protein
MKTSSRRVNPRSSACDSAAAARESTDARATTRGRMKPTVAQNLVSFSLPSRSPNRPGHHPNHD